MPKIEELKDRALTLAGKRVTLGFDGFIDSVVRVILNKDIKQPTTYFESIHAFGKYIVEKRDKNFSLELEEITTKLGGNMPIMANAVARLGTTASCIGSLGYPDIHPVFQQMPSNCHRYSYGNPGLSKVLEFTSGKIMLAEMEELNRISWESIRDKIGIRTFTDLFGKSDLVALLNWSELDNSTEVWKGLLRDVLPEASPSRRPIGFFDLSDCSKRTPESIREAVELIKSFSSHWDVALSLNLNEAMIIHSVLTQRKANKDEVDVICEGIFKHIGIDTVLIHHSRQAIARDKNGLYRRKSFFVADPAISSGSGDNFNAGFCVGRLMGLDVETSLAVGHATSSLYMQTKQSPDIDAVLTFLSSHEDQRSGQT